MPHVMLCYMVCTPLELKIVRMLRRSAESLSGRQVADIAGVAPNTAGRALRALEGRGLVAPRKAGRATLWTTTAAITDLAELDGSLQARVVLVVTALELEHTAVYNRLINAERVRVANIWMVRGEIPGDNIEWTVYLARAGMGNATSAALVGLAARDLSANVVAFVGIAAGLKSDDQRHSDVVVASRIHNPAGGKQVPNGAGSELLGRDITYNVPAPLVAVVSACISDSEWTSSPQNQHYIAKHAHAFMAPIVSVDAVQQDPKGPVLQEIRRRYQDAAALDMESFGLAAGSDIHDLPVLAVRGVSDFIGDKSEPRNDAQQPLAARNAAGLLRDVLAFAHPDDFRRGGPPTPPPGPSSDRSNSSTVGLPGSVQMWLDRLRRRSVPRATAAQKSLDEMRANGTSPATWLSRALHRPPAWLREDDTGDGWALMAFLASLSGSTVVWRAFERAAEASRLAGDLGSSAYFLLVARLERVAKANDQHGDGLATTPDPATLEGVDDDVQARLSPVIDFYRAVLEQDLARTKSTAEVALASLGVADPAGVLRPPAGSVRKLDLDSELGNLLAATMIRQLARMMLAPGAADQLGIQSGLAARNLRGNPVTRDLADDAMKLSELAVMLRPTAESARLTHAQTTLAVLISMTGRSVSDANDEISRTARGVETEAMLVRDSLRDWDGETGSALAIAARARSIQGDYVGALRMLRPAPDGVASQKEAQHPEVIRFGAHIAHVTGDDGLALELASKNPNKAEGALMRAAVLAGRPQMANEAKDALFTALAESTGHLHDDFRALMALSRRFNSLSDAEKTTVTTHIDDLSKLDPELADVMRARVLISQGDPEAALRHVRGLEPNELALDVCADALIASNRAEEAASMVFEAGISRGDIPLATEALELAVDNGLSETARKFALELLARDDAKPVRLKSLRALQRVALSEPNWSDVATRTVQVIDELHWNDLPVPEVQHWYLAEALFFLGKFEKALDVLRRAPAVSFSTRDRAQLFLTLVWRAVDERRARPEASTSSSLTDLGDPELYKMFMRAAADWAHDEQIATAALSVALTAPDSGLTESQIADLRDYAERYFDRHGENAPIQRISIGDDNLQPLLELLRANTDRQLALEDLARKVREGRAPLALLTEAAGRTTTESLIRRDLGYVMAVGEDGALGEQTVHKAVGGRVVADTTALVVAPWTGKAFRKLAANFDAVIVPASVREDIARARTNFAMKSTTTLGWDIRAQRPFLKEISVEVAQSYADIAEQVWADARSLQVTHSGAGTNQRDRWLSVITVAQDLGLPIWADDVVIRQLARSMNVPAFGSIDLIRALNDDAEIAAATTAFRDSKVVDLPIADSWHTLAEQGNWKLDSAFAVAISRPSAWRDLPHAFSQLRHLIQLRPTDMNAEMTAAWTQTAASGLALATDAAARPKVVTALLAWVITNADPFFSHTFGGAVANDESEVPAEAGQVTQQIVAVADALRAHHYPAAPDPAAQLVDILCRGLLDSAGPESTSRIIAALVKRLDRDTGHRLFAAYIQSAGK